MLEAANADPVSTISLKRSTQNLQLSTSWAGRLPHLWVVVSTGRRNTLSWREKMECDDGSEISSRFYGGREDGVMGSLAAWGVAQGNWPDFWQAVLIDLQPGGAAWRHSSSCSASLAVGTDAL